MFESVGWGEILVLALVGLFVLGPERLPGAIQWVTSTLRTVRDYATGAREQLRQELGTEEFEELRKPLEELRKPLEELRAVRNMDPRRAIRQHLLDPPADGSWSGAPTPGAPDPAVTAAASTGMSASGTSATGMSASGTTATGATATGITAGAGPDMVKPRSAVPDRLAAGEAAPLDPDAT